MPAKGKVKRKFRPFLLILKAAHPGDFFMLITINGKTKSLETEALLLSDLLKQEELHSVDGIAIAVNQEIVSRQEWEKTSIRNNDTILIIRATQGG